MFKFLHAADIHLDSPMRGLDRYDGAPVDACRVATRRALENLVALALAERVGLVLIAGDLYDGDWPDYNTGLFFCRQMALLREAEIPVCVIRGNHDAASRITRELRPPENVRFLTEGRPETVTFDELGLAVHGQSYAHRAVVDNLARGYPGRVPGLFNIGMLHTAVEGREGHDRYAPCELGDLRQLEYDYWALGHIHKRETLHAEGPHVAFPGNVQGRSVRETGAKGCLLVTVDDAGSVHAEPRWLDALRWEVCQVDASGAVDGETLVERFRDALPRIVTDAGDRLLALRVEFVGAAPASARARLLARWAQWSSAVRQTATDEGGGRVWVEKVVPRLVAPSATVDLSVDGPLRELEALIGELREDGAALRSLAGAELADLSRAAPRLLEDLDEPEHLRHLLDQVGPFLMSRLGASTSELD